MPSGSGGDVNARCPTVRLWNTPRCGCAYSRRRACPLPSRHAIPSGFRNIRVSGCRNSRFSYGARTGVGRCHTAGQSAKGNFLCFFSLRFLTEMHTFLKPKKLLDRSHSELPRVDLYGPRSEPISDPVGPCRRLSTSIELLVLP